jgi:hypothetical protein
MSTFTDDANPWHGLTVIVVILLTCTLLYLFKF